MYIFCNGHITVFIIKSSVPGSLGETITCCALYILRPVMLIWAMHYLKYLQGMLGFKVFFFEEFSKCIL